MGVSLAALPRFLWPLAVANLVANIGIVVTGGAVRLTGSGSASTSGAARSTSSLPASWPSR